MAASGDIVAFAGGATIGDGLAATDTDLRPWEVAVASDGGILVVDGPRVRRVVPDGVVTTVAGNWAPWFSGDGGPATSGSIGPTDLAIDASGVVYIADAWNRRLRKVSPEGVLTTIAGNGGYGDTGDGGPATSASFRDILGVAVDGDGNAYVADGRSNTVRRIAPSGTITRVAGGGQVLGDGLPATMAMLNAPRGLAVDRAGDLYIADTGNFRVRKVSRATGIITTVAGIGSCCERRDDVPAIASGTAPEDVAVESDGDILVVERAGVVRRIDSTGMIRAFAGTGTPGFSGDGGPAMSAQFDGLRSVAVGPDGTVVIADTGNGRLRSVSADGVISTIAGGGPPSIGDGRQVRYALVGSGGMAIDDDGNLYLADAGNHRVRKVDPSGVITTIAGTGVSGFDGDGGPAVAARLNHPTGVAVDRTGGIYVAELSNSRVRYVDRHGVITTVAGNGAVGFSGDGGPATAATLGRPTDVAVDRKGVLYIADWLNNRVRAVDRAGVISTVAGDGRHGFAGDGGPAPAASLAAPRSVAIDSSGNVYIADTENHRVRRIDRMGRITTVAGNGAPAFAGDGGPATDASFHLPKDVAFDGDGRLYVTDPGNLRLRRIDADGRVVTVAGDGTRAVAGDGGPAVRASFARPEHVIVDGAGDVLISDAAQHRRIVAPVS